MDGTYFYHSTPEVSHAVNNGEQLTDFKFSQFYINETSVDLTIILRNNLPILSPKVLGSNRDNKRLTVRNIYQFRSNEQIVRTIENINHYQKTYSGNNDLELIKSILMTNYNNDRFTSNCSITIDYKIDLDIILEHKHIYNPETDILIKLGAYNEAHPHPFSHEGHSINDYKESIKNKKVSGVFIELIDNENNINNRYTYMAKQLISIPVLKDKNKKSGVYFTKAEYDRLDEAHVTPSYYTYDEAENMLGIYKTREDAVTNGNPETIIKADLANKEKEILQIKHETSLRDLENKRIIGDMELEIERLKRSNALVKEDLEINKARRNDYYEDRSVTRKDNQEFIKYAPAAIAGLLTIFAIYNSTKDKKG